MAGSCTSLYRQAGIYYLVAMAAGAAVAVFFGGLGGRLLVDAAICGAVCFFFITIEAAILWKGLARNTRPSGALRGRLGIANSITLLRGWLIAVTAGVLTLQGTGALPARGDAVAWVPAVLYTVSLILDAVDGFIARKTSSVTPLGRLLENEYDSLGVLVLALFLSVMGRAYPFIALVGLARYLFVFAMWIRKRLGLRTYPLSHSKSGKIIAGLMMGYLSAGLWPVFSTRYVSIAGVMFFIPFAAGFLRDWLAVCGTIDLDAPWYRRASEWLTKTALDILPILLRVISAVLLVWLAGITEGRSALLLSAAVLLALGFAGRVVAIAAASAIAAGAVAPGLDASGLAAVPGVEVTLFVVVLLVFLCGTGRFSLWQPEMFFFRKKEAPS